MPQSLGEFLTFIGTAGAIGAVISWIASNWSFFQKQSSQAKMLILIVISIAMGALSHFAVKYIPAGVVSDLEPYYQIIINSIAIVLASQVYHSVTKDKTPTASFTAYTSTSGGLTQGLGLLSQAKFPTSDMVWRSEAPHNEAKAADLPRPVNEKADG